VAVSREAVEWAYRLFLGRKPESEAVIQQHVAAAASENELAAAFIRSTEFAAKFPAPLRIGKHLNEKTIDVQVNCADIELNAMLQRIACAWKKFGETQPHWSVITNERYLQKNLSENLDDFYESGRYGIDTVIATLLRNGINLSPLTSVVDFGCGVGRITLAAAARFKEVRGIDISPSHIALAKERAVSLGVQNVRFSTIVDFDALKKIETFDLLISFIVLQHNPPPVIAHTLDILLSKLNKNGVAAFQVPTFAAGYSFCAKDYLSNEAPPMEMNVIPQKELFGLIAKQGCKVLEVREDNSTGSERFVSQRFLIQKSA
jgi:2-polyprenyl-3-methyl-5-hydroxy-6-metoxy-1,4-benzoquinol methylase